MAGDLRPVDETCECAVCKNFSRAYLHQLFCARSEVAGHGIEFAYNDAHTPSEGDELRKRTVLLDLQQLGAQDGVKLTKEWTMDDRLEDMLLELRRHALVADEKNNVGMMRDGMKLLLTGVEMVNNRMGLLDLDGWSTSACNELGKHDANLVRIYRKYWQRSTSNTPEVEIAMALMGSAGMYHIRRTMSKSMMNRASNGRGVNRKERVAPNYHY